MKPVQSTENVTIKVMNSELIEGKWLPFQILSKKLSDLEKEKNMGYKSLRNKLYNSKAGDKYNIAEKAGIVCFDTDEPMKGSAASLVLKFERV